MQRRGYKGTSTLRFQAQIPSQSTSAIEGTDYLEHVDCAIYKKQSVVDVVNAADDGGGNEEGTESFGDNDEVQNMPSQRKLQCPMQTP